MAGASLQIQTVLYGNDRSAVLAALDALDNALSLDAASSNRRVTKAVVRYGDASPKPLFSKQDIVEIDQAHSDILHVEYIHFGENTGTARGHNLLAKDSDAEYIMVMNPDIVVSPTFFSNMFSPFDETSRKVGLVEARQVPIEHPKDYDVETGETGWASTAAVVFPLSVFQEVGGFDAETFFMYGDDVDFSWMIRLAGYTIVYQPRALAYHAKTLDRKGGWEPTSSEVYYSAIARLLLMHKWSYSSLCEQWIERFSESEDEADRKAVHEFLKRRDEGRLPRQIDAEHSIGYFVGSTYTKHRFGL